MKRSLIIILAFTLFLYSCSNKVNKENYDKISNGMTISQVESILGKGESQASSSVDLGEIGGSINSEVKSWQKGSNIITITFSNGQVLAKAQSGL